MNVWRLLPSYFFTLILGSALCGVLNYLFSFSAFHERNSEFILAFAIVAIIISFLSSLLILVAVMIVAGNSIKKGNSKALLLRKTLITHLLGTAAVVIIIILFNATNIGEVITTVLGIGVYYVINLLLWVRIINKKYLKPTQQKVNSELLDSF